MKLRWQTALLPIGLCCGTLPWGADGQQAQQHQRAPLATFFYSHSDELLYPVTSKALMLRLLLFFMLASALCLKFFASRELEQIQLLLKCGLLLQTKHFHSQRWLPWNRFKYILLLEHSNRTTEIQGGKNVTANMASLCSVFLSFQYCVD